MMTPRSSQNTNINPKMVILGRESRGLSQKMLADALGVPQSRISMIEMGARPVPDDLLEGLSQVLNYPQHFFSMDGGIVGVGVSEVFHRKRRNVPQRTLSKIYAHMELCLKHVDALLRAAELSWDMLKMPVDQHQGRGPEEIARAARAFLHLPRGPVTDLTQTLEEAGVLVIAWDFETRLVDALSRWVLDLPPMFFVNRESPKDRLRFSLAHELGHIVMHEVKPNPNLEEQADRFASEFLLPERDIRADLHDLDLAKLVVLKQYWKVSMAAILKRAEDLEAITPNRARYLWTQMAQAGYKTREPVELDVIGENPRLLHEIIEVHRKDLGYTDADLQVLIPLNFDELKDQYLQDPDHPQRRLKLVRA